MTLRDLAAVVRPPLHPVDGEPLTGTHAIEAALGVALPKEATEFGRLYGSGTFGDSVEILNPFSSVYLERVEEVSGCYRDLKRLEGNQFIPYDIHPRRPGLLVCGSEVNGHMLFWLTEGDPDRWPLVLMAVDGEFQELQMSFSEFLVKTFRGEMSCILWEAGWAKENFFGIGFHPKDGGTAEV